MIASLSGVVQKVDKDSLVVGVGGVGVRVFAPRLVIEQFGATGRAIKLHTYLIVREKELSLYGFESEEALNLFEVLLDVNGVGPRVGLAILSTLSPEVIKGAIVREEPEVLQRVPGIGKKTAERIMFQLRDKLEVTTETTEVPLMRDVDADVIDVLTTLGFSIVEAHAALQNIPREEIDLDTRVQLALQYLDQT